MTAKRPHLQCHDRGETKKKETERGDYLEHNGGKRLSRLDLGFDLKRLKVVVAKNTREES
jgi:hypothetical protein